LGFATGALWGNFAWGPLNKWLLQDTKILGALVALLLYFAYFILRGAINDDEKRARISGVYAIFAWVMFIVFIYVTPRMTETLHPGNGGNPAFSSYDLDSHLRIVFYPAVVGWILVGLWITSTRTRIRLLQEKIYG
jgi:heme exporter protein C